MKPVMIKAAIGTLVFLSAVNMSAAQSVTLAWDASPGATGYLVSYGTASRSQQPYPTTVDVGNVTQWPFTPPTLTNPYYISVQAYNPGGSSGYSNEVLLEPLGTVPAPPGSGDFNLDGFIDLMWQNKSTGALVVWFMSGTTMLSGALFDAPTAGPEWRLAASADLDRDGHLDFVWQRATGSLAAWLMSGTRLVRGSAVTPGAVSDTAWRLSAAADFTGDGRADFVWQHTTQGILALWEMDGTTLIRGRALTPDRVSDVNWQIVGTGDFDADGQKDLVWHNAATGVVAVWLMNGTAMRASASPNPNGSSDRKWRLRAVADLNADGNPDLLWQHDDGYLVVWLMNGVSIMRATSLNPATLSDLNWMVVGPR